MSSTRPVAEYVMGSSVRSDILTGIADGTRTTEALLETLEASESAVYGAVNELERRGLIHDDGDEWQLTGSGRLVTDLLVGANRTEELLGDDADYWESHDASVLPERFRTTLTDLAGARVVRATDTDPHRVVRTVAERIEVADAASIVSPIYQDEYATGLPGSGDVRLLLGSAIFEDAQRDALQGADPPSGATIRIADVSFALTVTDDCVMLSLPDLEGQYDTRSEIIAEHDRALDWGQRLFSFYWEQATPVEHLLDE